MKRRTCRTLGVALFVFASACGDGDASTEATSPEKGDSAATESESTEPSSAKTFAARSCPKESTLDYENFGARFFLTWCTGCHSSALPEKERKKAPLGVDFNTVDEIRSLRERIWMRAGDANTTMPPAGGPSAKERAMLGQWLACGAK
jgi:uncharacterized membrane protein